MSSYTTKAYIKADSNQLSQACRWSLNEMQVSIAQDAGSRFVAKEKGNLLSFANPAKLEINITPLQSGCTLSISSSNFGVGPVQGGHVKGVAETFLSKIRLKLSETPQQPSIPNLANELANLASLKDQGLLTEEEFTAAKAKLL
jgi:hypothetical protein